MKLLCKYYVYVQTKSLLATYVAIGECGWSAPGLTNIRT